MFLISKIQELMLVKPLREFIYFRIKDKDTLEIESILTRICNILN